MSEIKERLVGFDVREALSLAKERLPKWWDTDRRKHFLLDEKVALPLSLDGFVWMDVHELNLKQNAKWAYLSVWPDLGLLRSEALSIGEYDRSDFIAVTWVSCDDFKEGLSIEYGMQVNAGYCDEPLQPASLDKSWIFLGYDIVDSGHISALLNCGYSPDEKAELAKEFLPLLNEHHLFADKAAALRFRDIRNKQIPEHVPFFVVGLWLIPKEYLENTFGKVK